MSVHDASEPSRNLTPTTNTKRSVSKPARKHSILHWQYKADKTPCVQDIDQVAKLGFDGDEKQQAVEQYTSTNQHFFRNQYDLRDQLEAEKAKFMLKYS